MAENTITNRFSIGLHWLEFTIFNKDIFPTICCLNFYYDNDFNQGSGSLYGYINMTVGKAGIMILSDSRLDHHHVIIPGRWLSEVGQPSVFLLSELLFDHNAKMSRIDIACDDHTCDPDPKLLREYCNAGQLVTRFKTRNSLENHNDESVTNYFGSMRSDRFIRVYDKTKETKGNITACRWEIVLRKEYAQQAAEKIVYQGCNKVFLSTLHSLLDFRIPTSQKRESRRKQMDWYVNFLAGCEKAEYTRYEPIMTLERMEHWLQKQVSRTLATVVEAHHGEIDFVVDLINIGSSKIKRKKEY